MNITYNKLVEEEIGYELKLEELKNQFEEKKEEFEEVEKRFDELDEMDYDEVDQELYSATFDEYEEKKEEFEKLEEQIETLEELLEKFVDFKCAICKWECLTED